MNFWFSVFWALAFLIMPQRMLGQNLVPNGSFENYNSCPGSYHRHPLEFKVDSWSSVSSGSPDYFNICSAGEADVPYNWAGTSDAFHGNGYVGIFTWMNLPRSYREYIHCKLNEPLIKDSLYYVEFRYKLSSYSKFSTDRIGLLLSDSLAIFPHDKTLGISPTFTFEKDSAITPETGAWEIASAEFRALGHEQFLTIGNFSDNRSTQVYEIKSRPVSEPMLAASAYYYIDDVKVVPGFLALPAIEEDPVFPGGEPKLNTTYVLKNIQFAFNSYALLPVSFGDLDQVATFLHKNPEVKVTLSGHTDDVGSAGYNQNLSANRARSAAAYLLSKGIDDDRIATIGFGESRPLVEWKNEAAREANRRVEIEFHR